MVVVCPVSQRLCIDARCRKVLYWVFLVFSFAHRKSRLSYPAPRLGPKRGLVTLLYALL